MHVGIGAIVRCALMGGTAVGATALVGCGRAPGSGRTGGTVPECSVAVQAARREDTLRLARVYAEGLSAASAEGLSVVEYRDGPRRRGSSLRTLVRPGGTPTGFGSLRTSRTLSR